MLIESALIGSTGAGHFTQTQKMAADVNGDGIINSSDATDILIYSAARGAGATHLPLRSYFYEFDQTVKRLSVHAGETPYVVCDGINEAGLGVSTLQLDIGELHQDTGKPDLYVYTAICMMRTLTGDCL